MACALSANSCSTITTNLAAGRVLFNKYYKDPKKRQRLSYFRIRASTADDEDCNVEECAPEKEVGKVSMEWLAGEKTKVTGTFPPRNQGWTGYVEKDTAGQTNIYSIEFMWQRVHLAQEMQVLQLMEQKTQQLLQLDLPYYVLLQRH